MAVLLDKVESYLKSIGFKSENRRNCFTSEADCSRLDSIVAIVIDRRNSILPPVQYNVFYSIFLPNLNQDVV